MSDAVFMVMSGHPKANSREGVKKNLFRVLRGVSSWASRVNDDKPGDRANIASDIKQKK